MSLLEKSAPALSAVVMLAAAVTATKASAGDAGVYIPAGVPPLVRSAILACQTDAQKYCAGVQPGGGRIARCLASQSDALDPACRVKIEEVRAAYGR